MLMPVFLFYRFLQTTKKGLQFLANLFYLLSYVGVRRFELPTTRPPDAYSNLAELHPGAFPKSAAKLRAFCVLCNRRDDVFTNFHTNIGPYDPFDSFSKRRAAWQ